VSAASVSADADSRDLHDLSMVAMVFFYRHPSLTRPSKIILVAFCAALLDIILAAAIYRLLLQKSPINSSVFTARR